MTLLRNSPSIVIVGAWNPAILQPHWLAHDVFQHPREDSVSVQAELSPQPGLPPRFTLDGLLFVPSYEKLTVGLSLKPSESIGIDSLQLAEDKARKILALLPHTPINAFGENFEFQEDNPSDELLAIFESNDNALDEADIHSVLTSTSITSSLKIENHALNLTRTFHEGRVTLRFNFHYEASSATEAHTIMNNTFSANYRIAEQVLSAYNVKLEDIEEDSDE